MWQTILKQFRNLFPSGRAFNIIDRSIKEKFFTAIAKSLEEWYLYVKEINYSLLADNENFTDQDATNWERRIGLFVKEDNSLDIRKDTILRKYGQRGRVQAKNSSRYIQLQLNRAGFDVYVHENYFPDGFGGYETRNLPSVTGSLSYSTTTYQDNELYLGAEIRTTEAVVANSIDPAGADSGFILNDDSLLYSFFISGETYDQVAEVSANRQNELRQLIIALKPTHTIALLNLRYV